LTVRGFTNNVILATTYLLWAALPQPAVAGETATALCLRPREVSLGIHYHGRVVHAEGTAPAGDKLALVCAGRREDLRLKKKEKVLGLLWLNRGEVHFASVPSLYLLDTSDELSRLASLEALNRLGVGCPALEAAAVGARPPDQQSHRLFAELLKLKQREKLFAVSAHGVLLQERPEGVEHWSADLRLPTKLAPGDYEVRLFGFQQGQGKLLARQALEVRQVGAAAAIHSFARKQGLLYGIGAVLIALAAGVLTGFVFGLGSKGGH